MRRLRALGALTVPLLVVAATPAVADRQRMQLDCGGELGVIERANGASWWGGDGTVYTTKYLLVSDNQGNRYEKFYGHVARQHLVCRADHDVDGYESHWTVHLVLSS